MAKVAILLATYNGEKYIRELLESLENQTMQDFHCYIHDDGSSDRTVEIIRKITLNKSNYSIIDGISTGGSAANFMFLLNFVKDEEYIMFCDQDDIWKQNKIKDSVELYESNAKASNLPTVVCTDLTVVSENLEVISDSYFAYENRNSKKISFNDLIKKNVSPGCTMLINLSMVHCLMNFSELSTLILHDWATIILAALYGDIYILNESTILYRQHSGNVVGAVNKTGISGLKRQILEILRFKKLTNIRNSIELEKKIIKLLIEKNDNKYIQKYDVHNLNGLFSKKKIIRVITYWKANKQMGFRGIVRSLFV